MKYLYQCQKCGKVYEDSDSAWNCEATHADIDKWSEYETAINAYTEWKTGCALPNKLVLNTYPVLINPGQENEQRKVFFGLYELKRPLNEDETAKIIDSVKQKEAQ